MPECRPQDLGEREDEMPVGDGADHLLPDELGPQGGALGGTGRAKIFRSFIAKVVFYLPV